MKKTHIISAAAVACAATFLAPAEASAADWIIKDDSSEKRPWELGVLVGVPLYGGDFNLDPGVVLGIPLVDKGFVPINDSFYLELGAWTNLHFSDPFRVGVTPFGGVRWNFHLMEIWDAYAAARVGAHLGSDINFNLDIVAGTTWKFSKKIGLRGELGGGMAGGGGAGSVKVGIDIDF